MEPKYKDYRVPFGEQKIWREHLEREGFVVIANYLPQKECQHALGMAWDIMEHLSQGKLNRNDEKTQKLSNCYPPVLHGGMIQYVGHSQMQWDLRKMCKPIFQEIWSTKDLKSSFDGFCFMNGVRNYKDRPANSFLHCDQAGNKNFLWSYQGLINLTDSGQNGGGFVVVPRTNHYHHEYFEKKKMLNCKDDWYLVPEEEKLNKPFIDYVKLDTEAGDFILWDSRTFHCNTVPTEKSLRVCVYICMIPACKVQEKIKEKRKEAYKSRRVSTHHPGSGFRLFPTLPRFVQDRDNFLKLVGQINDAKIDEQTMSLI